MDKQTKETRKVISVALSQDEWEFLKNAMPEFTNVSKMFKVLALSHFNYPLLEQKYGK